jgi:hypothetical protein
MNLILAIGLICLSLFLGILIGAFLRRRSKYNGIINVIKTPDKTTYSIELNHPTEVLQTVKEATFKIQLPDEDPVA